MNKAFIKELNFLLRKYELEFIYTIIDGKIRIIVCLEEVDSN